MHSPSEHTFSLFPQYQAIPAIDAISYIPLPLPRQLRLTSGRRYTMEERIVDAEQEIRLSLPKSAHQKSFLNAK